MNRPLILLCLASFAAETAVAAPCTDIQIKVSQLSTILAHKDHRTADLMLSALLASHSTCPALTLAAARLASLRGESNEAQSLFGKYLHDEPDSISGRAYLARFLMSQENYTQAYTLSSDILTLDPNQSTALAVHGQLLLLQGKKEAGMEELTRAVQRDPDDVEARYQLGVEYDQLRQPKDVVEQMEQVVKLDHDNPSAWDYIALGREALGLADRAEDAYKQGMSVNFKGPDFDYFLDYNYGRFLAKRNRQFDSVGHLDRAVRLVPDVRAVWYERAKVYLELGEYTKARSDGEKAESLTDQTGGVADLQIYVLLEKIYQRLGMKDQALKYAELARNTLLPRLTDER